jgi:hypothetical protein
MASAFDETLEQARAIGKENTTYRQPMLFVAGKAVDLVQGGHAGQVYDSCNGQYGTYAKPSRCG